MIKLVLYPFFKNLDLVLAQLRLEPVGTKSAYGDRCGP